MSKKKKTQARFHWMIFGHSYLIGALVLIKELKNSYHFKAGYTRI